MDLRLDARPSQDGGDVARRLVGRLVVGIDAELTERLAVVAADEHRRPVEDPEVVELVAQRTERVVGVADADVVAVENGLHVVRARRLPRLPRRRVAPLVGSEPPRLLSRVRIGELPVPGEKRTPPAARASMLGVVFRW